MNDYWICDEGRYSYKAANDPNLLAAMYVRKNDDLQPVAIDEAVKAVDQGLKEIGQRRWDRRRRALAVLDRRGSLFAGSLLEGAESGQRAGSGAGADTRNRPDVPARPDQGPNRRYQLRRPAAVHDPRREVPEPAGRGRDPGAFRGEGRRLRRADSAGGRRRIRGLYVASDAIEPWIDEAESESLRSKVRFLVVEDTTVTPLAHQADVVLAGATFAEKAGSYVNADGRLQYSEAALPPRDGSLPDLDMLAIFLHRPAAARSIRATSWPSWPRRSPPSAPPREESCRRYGVSLGRACAQAGRAAVPPSFTDTWFVAHGVARRR